MSCNHASTPTEGNLKLVKNKYDELVDPTLFKQIIGSLRYMSNNGPNIAYVVGIISRFMSEPRSSHQLVAKRVMRYINVTLGYGILFPTNVNGVTTNLIAYSDAD